jgi:hypothetical protein
VLTSIEDDVVDDLAVITNGGGFSLWVFYRSGRAELHTLYAPHGYQKRTRYIGGNGLVYDTDSDDMMQGPKRPAEAKDKGRVEEVEEIAGHVRWAGLDGDGD